MALRAISMGWSFRRAFSKHISKHDEITRNNVFPENYINPIPAGKYNMVAIGSGAGGLVASIGTALTGGKSAIIEREALGGDWLNTGCVPSKALVKCAHEYTRILNADKYGVVVTGEIKLDFQKVIERVRATRAEISHHDSVPKLRDHYGVDVYLGSAAFTGPNTLEIDGRTLEFSKCAVATGGRPIIPVVPGIETVPVFTSENIWNL